MGTNYYRTGFRHSNDPKYHIGKRSPAGFYCWDCNVTLCKTGEANIHKIMPNSETWFDRCPRCGAEKIKETLNDSGVGRALGLNLMRPKRKTGVRSCLSFSWARRLGKIRKIEDEYGNQFTRKEFEAILEECPVQYYHMIGKEFR